MLWVLVVVLLVLALASLPISGAPLGHWHSWGYAPSSVGLVIVILLVLLLLGRL